MNAKTLISVVIIFGFFTFTYSQDTVFLNEVKILKSSLKNSKAVVVKSGFKNNFLEAGYITGKEYFLFHKIIFPLGQPLEIALYFSTSGDQRPTKHIYDIEESQYELDIFEMDIDGNVGSKINNQPFIVKFEKGKMNAMQSAKRVISLQHLNLFGNSFYIRLNPTFKENCKSCHYYYSLGEKSEKSNAYFIKKDEFKSNTGIFRNWGFNLRYKLKVFTNEY